jgi:nucleotide-binding universal stress UspA family protein
MAQRTGEKQTLSEQSSQPAGASVFRRMLVVLDESPAARSAFAFACGCAKAFGAALRFVQPETSGHTLGARNRGLAKAISESAEAFGADVIVLGLDHSRLARHRIAPSLRKQLARVTDLPLLVAPRRAARTSAAAAASGAGRTRGETRAERRYAHV